MGFAAVTVIDDDLGRSGSGRMQRPGFERLVALVCSGDVGAVYCIEASRLARNGRDWHHLIDLVRACRQPGRRSGRRLRSTPGQRPPAARAEGDDVGIRAEPDATTRPCGARPEGGTRRVPVHAAARLLLERGGEDRDRSRRACRRDDPSGLRQVPRAGQRAAGLPVAAPGRPEDARRAAQRRRLQARLEGAGLSQRHADPAQSALRRRLCLRPESAAHEDRRRPRPQDQRLRQAERGMERAAARRPSAATSAGRSTRTIRSCCSRTRT